MGQHTSAEALRRSAQKAECFESFYRDHFEALLAYFARRVYDPEVAFDLTAETFAQAYLARNRFRGSSDAEAAAWLYGIGRRQLALYFRKSKVERRALRRLGIEPTSLDEGMEIEIQELAKVADLRTALRIELRRLGRAQREALQLRVVEELSYPEVARRLEISEEAARARVSRGLKALAAGLDRNPAIEEMRA